MWGTVGGGVCVGNRRGRGLCRIGAKGNGWLQVATLTRCKVVLGVSSLIVVDCMWEVWSH